ncbi:MAG: hypothetical protein WDN69_15755 [Aliidongia sp.]
MAGGLRAVIYTEIVQGRDPVRRRAGHLGHRVQPRRRLACGHDGRRSGHAVADPAGRRCRPALPGLVLGRAAARLLLLVYQPVHDCSG